MAEFCFETHSNDKPDLLFGDFTEDDWIAIDLACEEAYRKFQQENYNRTKKRLRDKDSNHGSILDDFWSGWEHKLVAACEAAKPILQSDNIPVYEVEKEDQNGGGLSPTVITKYNRLR
ncbi:hypothetical protein AC249_AIPGENE22731 [Exaiptasia diaphana]|nr:hypothetical protein AC249_AIPGENE22731 [Exaiptasia diaphana]